MRWDVVHRPHFRHNDDREIQQAYCLDRYDERKAKRREANRLLRDDHPMLVVSWCDLGDIVPVPIIVVMMGRKAGVQRHEDEDYNTVNKPIR